MHAKQELVERQPATDRNHDFAVQYKPFCTDASHRFNEVGKVAGQRLSGVGLKKNFVAVSKSETAKTVHFGSYCHSLPTGGASTRNASMGGITGFSSSDIESLFVYERGAPLLMYSELKASV